MNRWPAIKAWLWGVLPWVKKNKLLVAAGVLTAGEAMVSLGIPLPGSEWIPVKFRGAAIALIIAGAFVFRTLSMRREENRQHGYDETDEPAPCKEKPDAAP